MHSKSAFIIGLLTAMTAASAYSGTWATGMGQSRARGQLHVESLPSRGSPNSPLGFGDEFLLDTTVFYGPEEYGQEHPAVACGQSNALVAWLDERAGDKYIRAARISSAGLLLDSIGIEVFTSTDYFGQEPPAVATDGRVYLVVWDVGAGNSADLYGTIIDEDGTCRTPGGFPICTAVWSQGGPAAAFDGTNYLVVWQDQRNGAGDDIYAARVGPGGNVLDPYGIPINIEAGNQNNAAVAFGGGNYLVAWHDDRNGGQIYAARVSPSGAVLDPYGFAVTDTTGSKDNPSVAFDGHGFWTVWQDARRGQASIYGARISLSGQLLDSSGVLLSNDTAAQSSPGIVPGTTDCLVLWSGWGKGNNDIYGVRVTPEGAVLDSSELLICGAAGDQTTPVVARDSLGYFAAWDDKRNGVGYLGAIYGARIRQSGEVIDISGIFISPVPNRQYAPRVACDGSNYLVVFEDRRDGASDVYGMRVSQDGIRVDPAGISIAAGPNFQMFPAVAAGDTCYLIAWEERPALGVKARRMKFSGEVLDSVPLDLGSGDYPDVAFDGTNFFAAWQSGSGIRAARISQSGQLLSPGIIALQHLSDNNTGAAIGCSDSCCLISWVRSWYSHPYWYSRLCAARVRADGVILDTFPMTLYGDYAVPARVIYDGLSFLVVYRQGGDVVGRLVAPDGSLDSTFAICRSTALQSTPTLSFDGSLSHVVWSGRRNGTFDNLSGADLQHGTVIDSFCVTNGTRNPGDPSLACGGQDRMLVAYTEMTDSINGRPVGMPRVWCKLSPFSSLNERATGSKACQLIAASPNPFRDRVSFTWSLMRGMPVSLHAYDAAGRQVCRILDRTCRSGQNSLTWDGADDRGRRLPAGVYFVRFKTATAEVTCTVTLLP